MALNVRNFSGHSGRGVHNYQEWDPDDPRKTNPDWNYMSHSSGLGRGSYRFHKRWSLANDYNYDQDIALARPYKIYNTDEIEIPIQFKLSYRKISGKKWGYHLANIKGHYHLEKSADTFGNPNRDSFFYDIRLALVSINDRNTDYCGTTARVYQTKSKITRITFEK